MTKPYQISKQLVWKAYQQVNTKYGTGSVPPKLQMSDYNQ